MKKSSGQQKSILTCWPHDFYVYMQQVIIKGDYGFAFLLNLKLRPRGR